MSNLRPSTPERRRLLIERNKALHQTASGVRDWLGITPFNSLDEATQWIMQHESSYLRTKAGIDPFEGFDSYLKAQNHSVWSQVPLHAASELLRQAFGLDRCPKFAVHLFILTGNQELLLSHPFEAIYTDDGRLRVTLTLEPETTATEWEAVWPLLEHHLIGIGGRTRQTGKRPGGTLERDLDILDLHKSPEWEGAPYTEWKTLTDNEVAEVYNKAHASTAIQPSTASDAIRRATKACIPSMKALKKLEALLEAG